MKLDGYDAVGYILTALIIIGFISVIGAVGWGIWNIVSIFI